jgi:AraC-like DNA-binding protein
MANHGQSMAIIDRKSAEEPEYFSQQVRSPRRFFRSLEDLPSPSSAYQVVSGGSETCIPGYEVNRVDFPYWAVELVTSGRGTAELSGRSYDLIPGAICTYGPGIPHRIKADRGEAMEKHFIDVAPAAGGRTAAGSTKGDAASPARSGSPPLPTGFAFLSNHLAGRVTYCSAPESLRRTFDEIAEYGRIRTLGSARVCAGLFNVLLLKIAETAGKQGLAESAAFDAYWRCRTIIDERFPKLSTAAEVADAASVDVSYLCRLFRRFDSETAYGRLTRLRMDHAAGLMIREGLSVKQAASELGYEDPFTFSRRFKKVMGVSPRDFAEKRL